MYVGVQYEKIKNVATPVNDVIVAFSIITRRPEKIEF